MYVGHTLFSRSQKIIDYSFDLVNFLKLNPCLESWIHDRTWEESQESCEALIISIWF